MSLKSPFVYVVTQVQMHDHLPSKHRLCAFVHPTEYVRYGRMNLCLQHCVTALQPAIPFLPLTCHAAATPRGVGGTSPPPPPPPPPPPMYPPLSIYQFVVCSVLPTVITAEGVADWWSWYIMSTELREVADALEVIPLMESLKMWIMHPWCWRPT